MEEKNIMVSICCLTYNHEEYVKDAIEGFLMQKTNFPFEIIIHDDASTDKTQEIIKQYQEKYPDIIKPILQTENQYKKGVRNSYTVFKAAKGKYIAFCEGDDYWIDKNKLQKQVDYMEEHNDCTFCFHNGEVFFEKQNKKHIFLSKKQNYKKFFTEDNKYNVGNVHLLGFGSAPTASFMFRTENVEKLPDFYFKAFCGDMPLKLIMTSFGYAYYLDDIMCVYRRETGISMTDQWKKENNKNVDKAIEREKKTIKILEDVDQFSDYKYTKGIQLEKSMYQIEILLLQEKYKEIFKDKNYKEMYKLKHNDKFLIKLFIKTYLNGIYKIIKKTIKK